ncbi:MAG: thermonuclease family protein [Chloroflexi bacterium]|nr:thermonuclease family protein [Chloroflexota bacterium]MCY3938011.1 thermonuclease family protein [Chloroflexota bacterium]
MNALGKPIRLPVLAVAILLIVATACTAAELEQELRNSEARFHARLDAIESELQAVQDERNVVPVTRVIDGDTVEVTYRGHREKVRYLDVWAPERDEEGGVEATAYNASLVEGQTVRLEITDKANGRDSFGRLLADVYLLDGRHVNALVVENTAATADRH